MLFYCFKCRKNREIKNPKVVMTKKRKKDAFIKMCKTQDASELLISLGIKTSLSKILLVGLLLFQRYKLVNTTYRINEILNEFLLAGDKYMPEMYLRQPG